MHRQKKFTSLDGSSEHQGDLKSIVLHSMKVSAVKSDFPLALGTKITGVDDSTFSATGEAFSTVVLPHADSHNERTIQSDDVSLAYGNTFAKLTCCPAIDRFLNSI